MLNSLKLLLVFTSSYSENPGSAIANLYMQIAIANLYMQIRR